MRDPMDKVLPDSDRLYKTCLTYRFTFDGQFVCDDNVSKTFEFNICGTIREQSVMEIKRSGVIALYSAGKSQTAIVRELRLLKVNKMFVYRTIKRYNETGSIEVRHGGGSKKTATSAAMVQKVKRKLAKNPNQSANQMAKELNVSARSIGQILKNDLRVKAHRIKGGTKSKPKTDAKSTPQRKPNAQTRPRSTKTKT